MKANEHRKKKKEAKYNRMIALSDEEQAKMDMIARRRAMRQHQEGIYMSKKRGPTGIIAEGPMIGMPVCVYRGTAYRYNQ